MSRRLTDDIARWIEEELDRLSLGDTVWFELGLFQQQVAPNQIAPMLMCSMWMKGAILNTVLHTTSVFQTPTGVEREHVTTMVVQTLEELRTARSESLKVAPQEAVPVQ